jgi:protein-disulfide isomerase
MNKRAIVIGIVVVAATTFAASVFLYERYRSIPTTTPVASEGGELVRPHSPVMGQADARVTIVEFFDPSCEVCRAFYPIVKQILAVYSKDVRLVLRYTPFHEGSDEAVRILEAARKQGKFEPVLEAILKLQGEWAIHGRPNLARAWEIAGTAGLDVERGRREGFAADVDLVLERDRADLKAKNVQRTPTFFVNGKPLPSFGPQQLVDLVESEIGVKRPSK